MTIPYVENFYDQKDADAMFEFLKGLPHRRMMSVKSGGKVPLRRVNYQNYQNYPGYSVEPEKARASFQYGDGMHQDLSAAPPEMLDLAARLSAYSGKTINYLSCIGYEDRRDQITPHHHREDFNRPDQSVYVVSYGQPRELRYGPRDPDAKKKFTFLGKP
jgi:hypothetical protein